MQTGQEYIVTRRRARFIYVSLPARNKKEQRHARMTRVIHENRLSRALFKVRIPRLNMFTDMDRMLSKRKKRRKRDTAL